MLNTLITRKIGALAYPGSLWKLPAKGNKIYLTFDDGPDPFVTPEILHCLARFKAKGTFFCLGKNTLSNPDILQRIRQDGHGIGNHTHSHLNGWKTPLNEYVADVLRCKENLQTPLFRPPYGRLTPAQAIALSKHGFRIVMWTLLSKDYDTSMSQDQVLNLTLRKIRPGSIVVFHDSIKAAPNILPVLPRLLEVLTKRNWNCAPLPGSI